MYHHSESVNCVQFAGLSSPSACRCPPAPDRDRHELVLCGRLAEPRQCALDRKEAAGECCWCRAIMPLTFLCVQSFAFVRGARMWWRIIRVVVAARDMTKSNGGDNPTPTVEWAAPSKQGPEAYLPVRRMRRHPNNRGSFFAVRAKAGRSQGFAYRVCPIVGPTPRPRPAYHPGSAGTVPAQTSLCPSLAPGTGTLAIRRK
jgi:hypothetical protein